MRNYFLMGCLLSMGFVHAAQNSYNVSGQSDGLDHFNAGARSAAMGSALAGTAEDASALFANPAGLAYLGQPELTANSNFWLVDTFQETLLLGLPAGLTGGNIALAPSYFNYGTFDGRDETGSLTSRYTANQMEIKLGGGVQVVKDLALGFGLEGSQNNLANNSQWAMGGNLGILARPSARLRLGASLGIQGFNLSQTDVGILAAASYNWPLDASDNLLTALNGNFEPGGVQTMAAGVEFDLHGLFFLRAGYQLPLENPELTGLTGMTAGAGLVLSNFTFDYAYLPYGNLGNSHRVSVGLRFGAAKESAGGSSASGRVSPAPSKSVGKGMGLGKTGTETLRRPPSGVNPSTAPGTETALVSSTNDGGSSSTSLNHSTEKPILGALAGAPSATSGGPPPVEISGSVVPKIADKSKGDKDSLVVKFDQPEDPLAEGQDLERKGKYREAVQFYLESVKENDQDASTWWALGRVYYRFKRKADAIYCFERVLNLEPHNQALTEWLEKYKAAQP